MAFAPSGARLFTAKASAARATQLGRAAAPVVARLNNRMRPAAMGLRMVATSPDVKKDAPPLDMSAPIFDKYTLEKEDFIDEYGAK